MLNLSSVVSMGLEIPKVLGKIRNGSWCSDCLEE